MKRKEHGKIMGKKISIIIPVYNCTSIDKAIRSIPKSNEIELIVVDGGSNRETLDIIYQYRENIDILISEKDNGLYDAMHKGIAKAGGTWILTLAADDQLICDPLKIIYKYEDQEADLLCGEIIAKDFKGKYIIFKPDDDINKLQLECTVFHPGTIFRKTVYGYNGCYDLSYKCAADHEFFLRLKTNAVKPLIISEMITFFSYGGLSTRKPIQAFKEDLRISDQYRVSKIKSRVHFANRVFRYYGSMLKDAMGLPHKTHLMGQQELEHELENHPEVVNRNLFFEEWYSI